MGAMLAVTVVACGSSTEQGGTSTAPSTSASTATAPAPAGTATTSATAVATASDTSVANVATDTPAPGAATATPTPTGDTGIAGIVTVGPTCPVERIDSPCPDRPYAARITVWRGTMMVAETRSGTDGRFTVLVPPGSYRVVGKSGATFPRGTEVTVTVVENQMTQVTLRFDSGIR